MAYYMRVLDAKFKKPPIIGLEVHLLSFTLSVLSCLQK
jgi:hypothetical protein